MRITLGAVVNGGTSLDYKTGTWRDQRPVFDYGSCVGCGVCEEVCPDSAIHKVNDSFIVDYDFCKGCGLCANECISGAIEMVCEIK
jgi:pyruvate ferredoxin oxidoreductase delta subunit